MIQNLLFGVTYLLINFRFSGRVSKSQSQQNLQQRSLILRHSSTRKTRVI